MGKKGAKLTSDAEAAAATFVARISGVGNVSSRKMFGGLGIFESGVMFGIVDSAGAVHLRRGEANAALFDAAGSHQHGKMPYWSIPDGVFADDSAVEDWARRAAEAAHAAKR